MMVKPVAVIGCQVGRDSLFLAGGMAYYFTAFANALVGLDMGTGGHLLQENLDRLGAGFAFEGQETCWLGWHGNRECKFWEVEMIASLRVSCSVPGVRCVAALFPSQT